MNTWKPQSENANLANQFIERFQVLLGFAQNVSLHKAARNDQMDTNTCGLADKPAMVYLES